jgi:Glyoxalase-like domain
MGHKATVELVLDCRDPNRLAKFWRDALDYRVYYTDARLTVLVPREGIASPLLLQGVPEPKVGKNRMHVDIVVDDVEAEVHRLRARRSPHRRRRPELRGNAMGQNGGSRAERVLRLHRRRVVTG